MIDIILKYGGLGFTIVGFIGIGMDNTNLIGWVLLVGGAFWLFSSRFTKNKK